MPFARNIFEFETIWMFFNFSLFFVRSLSWTTPSFWFFLVVYKSNPPLKTTKSSRLNRRKKNLTMGWADNIIIYIYLDLKISECSRERFEEGEAFVRDVRGDGNCLSRWDFFWEPLRFWDWDWDPTPLPQKLNTFFISGL